jgi:outer membrane cobalamin receptor
MIDPHAGRDVRARRLPRAVLLAALMGIVGAGAADAQQPRRDTARAPVVMDTISVTGRIHDLIGIAGTASEGYVGAADLRSRPITREGELLETVPGVIVTQHSGEGKANQYFVRGFNLDHGTDFRRASRGCPSTCPRTATGRGGRT